MHKFTDFIVALLLLLGLALIFACGKPSQTLFIYVDSQRVDTSDCYINPQIELMPIEG